MPSQGGPVPVATVSTLQYPPLADTEQRDSPLPAYAADESGAATSSGKARAALGPLLPDEEAGTPEAIPRRRPLSPYRKSRREHCRDFLCSECGVMFVAVTVFLAVYLIWVNVPEAQRRGQVELRLTGESRGKPGHNDLFRICASSFTTPYPYTAHTCNVYRPLHDVTAPPIHAFTEEIRHWESWSAADKAGPANAGFGDATIIQQVSLETLLLDQGLKCEATATPGTTQPAGVAQLVIGQVGGNYGKAKTARACYFDEKGQNVQDHCAEYADGGISAWATPHPLSINEIFQMHFGINCTWIEGHGTMV